MTTSREQNLPSSSRLDALKQKHAVLSTMLDEKMKYPATSDFDLRRLKLEKLKIKEEIENIRQVS